ncbi:MAG: hypothetical protein ACREJ9_16360 [Candidatus Rokuibacteriota bacterium]
MNDPWSWLALVGLGAFHGVNPAMGWLFAVALGLHRRSRAVVWISLVPIAAGHALAVTLVALVLMVIGTTVDQQALRVAAGASLLGWAVYHQVAGSRQRVRVGMRTGLAGLALWSFLMASAHGAGLMLVPVLLPHGGHGSSAGRLAIESLSVSLMAGGVHTFAMLTVTGVVAVAVYEWIGLAFLRRGWINLDLLWTIALVVTGVILLVQASH